MDTKERNAISLKATTEYRGLSDMEQALKMHEEEGISIKISVKACNLQKEQVKKTIIAKEKEKDIRVYKRPRLLTSKQEIELIKEIDEAEVK